MSEKTDSHYEKGDDIDLDDIVHKAVLAADPEPHETTLRMRLLVFLAVIVVVANSVIGIYNSLALKSEVQCNHQLTSALNVVSDQNRTNTKQIIDTVLSGKPLTAASVKKAREDYDAAYAANNMARQKLLKTTCSDGSAPTTPATSGSSGK